MFTYWTIIRWSIALAVSFYVIYRCRPLIRNIALRLIPMRHRISQDSFRLQTRYAILLSFAIGGLLAVVGNWSLLQASKKMGWIPPSTPLPVVSTPLPVARPLPSVPVVPPKDSIDVPIAPSIPPITPPTYEALPSSNDYYLQVGSFENEATAVQLRDRLATRLLTEVQVLTFRDTAPFTYKVVIGTFASRADALRYQDRHRLQGFPRRINK